LLVNSLKKDEMTKMNLICTVEMHNIVYILFS